MKYVAIIFTLIAILISLTAKGVVQEIEGSITLLMAIVMFCTVKVCNAIAHLPQEPVDHSLVEQLNERAQEEELARLRLSAGEEPESDYWKKRAARI